jgi:plastocyanin
MRKLSLVLSCSALIAVAACSSSSSTPDAAPLPTIDAAVTVDAAAAGVADPVDCATATSPAAIVTAGFAYSPVNTMINAGGFVKFTMPDSHNVVSTVPGLSVDFNATKCFKFATPGTYSFKCGPHQFVGTIVVTQVD